MKAIIRFFDMHMKLRIALQLLLDISPTLLLCCALVTLTISGNGQAEWSARLFDASMTAFVILTVPLFILSVILGKDLVEFEIYPFLAKLSLALRWISVLPMLLAGAVDVMIIATLLDIDYFTGFMNKYRFLFNFIYYAWFL